MTTLLQTVENDLVELWVKAEGFVEAEAIDVWDIVKVTVLGVAPAQWKILQGLLAELETDVATGDIADIETALLMKAEEQEITWVTGLGSALLQAVIALFRAQLPQPVANTSAS